MTIGQDAALRALALRKIADLEEHEARHPRLAPDEHGRPYDPWNDVIVDRYHGMLDASDQIDMIRSEVIARRTWEGFAWARHRFVMSDERGFAIIVGFNENAGRWFLDTNTPVRLPPEWVAQFMDAFDRDGELTGFEPPRDVHAQVVATLGAHRSTIPNLDEVTEYLRSKRA